MGNSESISLQTNQNNLITISDRLINRLQGEEFDINNEFLKSIENSPEELFLKGRSDVYNSISATQFPDYSIQYNTLQNQRFSVTDSFARTLVKRQHNLLNNIKNNNKSNEYKLKENMTQDKFSDVRNCLRENQGMVNCNAIINEYISATNAI